MRSELRWPIGSSARFSRELGAAFVALLLALCPSSCRSKAERMATGSHSDTVKISPRPSPGQVSPAARLDSLIASLATLAGSFKEVSGHGEFSGDQEVFTAIAANGDLAVAALVRCLDDTAWSAATVGGQRVRVGYMCYAALDRTAYFEWDPGEYRGGRWLGGDLTATQAAQVRRAKTAWSEVVAKKRYSLA